MTRPQAVPRGAPNRSFRLEIDPFLNGDLQRKDFSWMQMHPSQMRFLV